MTSLRLYSPEGRLLATTAFSDPDRLWEWVEDFASQRHDCSIKDVGLETNEETGAEWVSVRGRREIRMERGLWT